MGWLCGIIQSSSMRNVVYKLSCNTPSLLPPYASSMRLMGSVYYVLLHKFTTPQCVKYLTFLKIDLTFMFSTVLVYFSRIISSSPSTPLAPLPLRRNLLFCYFAIIICFLLIYPNIKHRTKMELKRRAGEVVTP